MCHGVTVSVTGCQRRSSRRAAACASLEPASGHPSAAQRLPVGVVKLFLTSMSLVLQPRSKKRFVRQSIPAKIGPNTMRRRSQGKRGRRRPRAPPMCLRRAGARLLRWSMQQSAPLVPLFLQVALISSLPPVFVTRTPLTAHSSPAASVRPRHQNSPYCWLWRRF
jgi:hypothetical protein